MNYYQHHIGDFIRDTARLGDSQCMAYLRLIWMYYDTEAPLPDSPKILAFKIGASDSDVSLILEAFFQKDGDVWRHSRCDEEIAAYAKFVEGQRAKGALGGRPRKTPQESSGKTGENPPGFRGDNDGEAIGKPEETPGNPNHSPLPNTSTTGVVDDGPASPAPDEEKPAKERKRKTKMPDDFAPNETGIRYANERGVHVAEEIQRMRNWAESNGVLRLDWQATWRTWCDKAVEFGRAGKPAARDQRPEKFDPTRYVNDPAYAAEWDRRNGNSQQQPEGGDHGCVIDAQSRRVA